MNNKTGCIELAWRKRKSGLVPGFRGHDMSRIPATRPSLLRPATRPVAVDTTPIVEPVDAIHHPYGRGSSNRADQGIQDDVRPGTPCVTISSPLRPCGGSGRSGTGLLTR